jgi:hypothetical protein
MMLCVSCDGLGLFFVKQVSHSYVVVYNAGQYVRIWFESRIHIGSDFGLQYMHIGEDRRSDIRKN